MPTRNSRHPAAETQLPTKRIVISFSIAVIAVVALVLYYSLGRATITLEFEPANTVMETVLTASAQPTGELSAVIAETDITDTKKFPASPSGELEEKASGTVTIVSSHTAPQILIATTRLLSPKGVLFRLSETVTAPNNGLVQAKVIADQPGEGSVIGPTRFTIPGLRQQLQEKIYAESSEPMSRTAKAGNQVTALDLEGARKILTDALVPQALAKLRSQLPEDKRKLNVVYKSDVTKADSSVAAGAKAAEFNYTVSLKVRAVFYASDELREQALAKLQNNLTGGRKVLTLQEESLAVGIETIANDLATAVLKVKFMAQISITDPNLAIKKDDLLGRTPAELKNYFSGITGVKNAEIDLWPFWVTAAPTLPDHITLQVKQ